MKKIFLIATMLLMCGVVNAQISDVEVKGQWIYVYGDNNERLCLTTISSDTSLEGYGSSFYVIRQGQWLYTKDIYCRTINSMTIGSYDVIRGVGGNSFTVKKGQWIYTYDKNCNQLNTRIGN